jgi:hypothetical protein
VCGREHKARKVPMTDAGVVGWQFSQCDPPAREISTDTPRAASAHVGNEID